MKHKELNDEEMDVIWAEIKPKFNEFVLNSSKYCTCCNVIHHLAVSREEEIAMNKGLMIGFWGEVLNV